MPSLLPPATPRSFARACTQFPAVPGYELVKLLSASQWFELFQARASTQVSAEADYVIKRCREDCGQDLPRALLVREAQVATSVSHANLVSLLDERLADATNAIILPFLPGVTLEQLRQSPGQISVPRALWYVRQIAAALEALHSAGWIHSDLRPANVIVSEQGHATLIDLGLARRSGTAECFADRWLAGAADYLAPECFQPQRELTSALDIYALGLMLLRLLQGNRAELNQPIESRRTFADLRVHRPDVSRDVVHLLAKMLAQEPLRRPSAGELVEIFARLEIESLVQA